MPSLYTITEPHPTVPQDSYTHSGRGGLGNFFRAPLTTSPSGVPTRTTTTTKSSTSTSSTPRRFYSGRGGAGNAHAAPAAAHTPALSFDEEFALRESALLTAAAVGHVGRGGAGNVYSSSLSSSKSVDGEALGRRDSASTEGSARSSGSLVGGFWGRVKSVGR